MGDCITIFLIVGAFVGYFAYRLLDKYFPWIFTGFMWIVRGGFIVLIIGALALGGFTGEEVILGAAWAALEWIAGKRPTHHYDDEDDDDDDNDDDEDD
ncbi:hypothetical protein HZB58_04190 [Candidatus Gottesmanbacteria bacterium]|nr:hypothetical protein [Candidatus Gottesmanbacteria bacterium]